MYRLVLVIFVLMVCSPSAIRAKSGVGGGVRSTTVTRGSSMLSDNHMADLVRGLYRSCLDADADTAARKLQDEDFLTILESLGGMQLHYHVTAGGQESDSRLAIYNSLSEAETPDPHGGGIAYAWQDSHWKQLSEAEIEILRSTIHDLPLKTDMPPFWRLVIVSVREKTNWMTRCYDGDTLPHSMRQIYDIIGERSESKKARQYQSQSPTFSPVDERSIAELPKVISMPEAYYPGIASRAGVEGSVHLRIGVDHRGDVMAVSVLQKAGYGMDEEALRVIWKSKWRPARRANHEPVDVVINYDLVFKSPWRECK
jgi:TonB family protein